MREHQNQNKSENCKGEEEAKGKRKIIVVSTVIVSLLFRLLPSLLASFASVSVFVFRKSASKQTLEADSGSTHVKLA